MQGPCAVPQSLTVFACGKDVRQELAGEPVLLLLLVLLRVLPHVIGIVCAETRSSWGDARGCPPNRRGTHARRVSAAGPAGAATGQGPQQLPVRQGCERTRQHLRDPGDAQTSQDSGPVSVGCRSRRPGRGPSTLAPLRGRGLAGSIGLHHGGQLVDDQLEDLDQQRDVCPALRVWEKEPDVTGSFLPLSPILLPPESDLGNTISSCLGSAGRSGAFY